MTMPTGANKVYYEFQDDSSLVWIHLNIEFPDGTAAHKQLIDTAFEETMNSVAAQMMSDNPELTGWTFYRSYRVDDVPLTWTLP